jgi:hypothetical protein
MLCALAIVGVAAAQDSSERTSVPFSDPSRPGTLKVALIQGSILVKGGDVKAVIIETRGAPDRFAPHEAEGAGGLHRLPQQPAISVDEQDNRITIGSPNPGRAMDLEIEVPRRTNLALSTVNQGVIRVEGVDGEIEVGDVNGSITLSDVSGSVVAHTINGNVTATIARASPQKPMAFASLNGAIDVTLPASIKANLKLRSDNGDIHTDFDVHTLPPPSRAVEDTRRSDGRHRIEVNKAIYGSVNGGGAEIELRTFNGSVYVRKGG